MLVRFLDGCKLLAWGMVAGSCVVAAIISHRAPTPIWPKFQDSPSLHAALAHEVARLRPVSWTANTQNEGQPLGECNADRTTCPAPRGDGAHQPETCNLATACYIQPEEPVTCSQPVAPPAQIDSEFVATNSAEPLDGDFVAAPQASNLAAAEAHSDQMQPMDPWPVEEPTLEEPTLEEPTLEQATLEQIPAAHSFGVQKLETCLAPEVTNRKVTMRDADTNQAVATLTIAGLIESSTLPVEAIELAKVERLQQEAMRSQNGRTAGEQQFVNAFRDEKSGHFTIETQTIEIADVANYFVERFGIPIVCHESAVGTVSASVSDVTLVRAIRKLVEPFGFAVVEYGPQIVIGELEALEHAARMAVAAHEVQIHAHQEAAAQAATKPVRNATAGQLSSAQRLTASPQAHAVTEPAKRLPPVGDVSQVSHEAPVIATQLTATPEETAIGMQAKAMVAKGQLAETVDLLTNAIQDYPNSAILYRMLSEVYLHRHDMRAAETAVKRSLAIDKSNPLANRIYGEILQQMGKGNRSQHYLQQAKFLDYRRSS